MIWNQLLESVLENQILVEKSDFTKVASLGTIALVKVSSFTGIFQQFC